MALPLAKLRLYLSLIPLLRHRSGITFREIGEHLGIPAKAAAREIPEALMLCGVPPYMPHDYIACFTEGDRVTVRFADHFKRPARLTPAEAASVLLALRALPPARGAPLAAAAAGLVRKIEAALGSTEVRELARRIRGRRAPGALGSRLALLERAVEEQRETEIEYYTQRRRALTRRRVRPYAILDHLGQFYLVGHDELRGKELSFRVDRIRDAKLLDARFERPRSFSLARWRRADFYRPGPGDLTVQVRFKPAAARFVREISQPSEIRELPDGGVERSVRTDSVRWVVDWTLQHGDEAEIVGPEPARAAMREALDAWLACYARTGSRR
jgi:proteasome accessory factor C